MFDLKVSFKIPDILVDALWLGLAYPPWSIGF